MDLPAPIDYAEHPEISAAAAFPLDGLPACGSRALRLWVKRSSPGMLERGPLANAFYVFAKPLDRRWVVSGLTTERSIPASPCLD